ncbi:MAG: NFACT RNA binding domain-containing protein [Nitrospinota bacterium]
MSITSSELAAVADELMELFGGRRVAKVHLIDRHDLVIHFREENKRRLFISVRPRFHTAYITGNRSAAPTSPDPFARLLRKHLSGCRLTEAIVRVNDRQLELRFEPGGHTLFCRMYRGGGLWLTDMESVVLGCAGYASKPPVKTGVTYDAPRVGEREVPADFDGSPSAELEKRYKEIIAGESFEAEKRALLAAVKKETTKCRRLIASLTKDRDRLTAYSHCKMWGDLCKTWFDRLKRGAKSVELPDPETGKNVTVPLKPELSPAQNVNLLYKNYRKYVTGIEKIDGALQEAETRRESLEMQKRGLDNAKRMEELEPFRRDDAVTERTHAQAGKRKGVQKSSPFRLFTSKDGFEIRVGKNNLSNDELVRSSNGNDLWFHLRDFPGSHVVVRAGGRRELPQSTIMEAANLALKYSSKARDKKGLVIYAHVKNVKKPKKAPPGQVTVTREKTIHARLS